jgi:hypothetical protein
MVCDLKINRVTSSTARDAYERRCNKPNEKIVRVCQARQAEHLRGVFYFSRRVQNEGQGLLLQELASNAVGMRHASGNRIAIRESICGADGDLENGRGNSSLFVPLIMQLY